MKKLDSSLKDLVISQENVEKKLLQKFQFLNDQRQLHNLFLSYDFRDNEENMVRVWEQILNYLYLDIFTTFGMKISEIKTYTMINNQIPTGLMNIIQELRIRQKLITDFDLTNQSYYYKYYPELYPEKSSQGWGTYIFSGVKNLINFGSIKMGCAEEQNDDKIIKRDDISEDEKYNNLPANTIIFNYEMFKRNCKELLDFLSEVLQETDNEVITKKEFIKNVNNASSNGGMYNGINLLFGSIYIDYCLIYLEKIKKIAIFTIEQDFRKIEFIKLLINPNDKPNEKDKITAQILIKTKQLQIRINELEKKINLCMDNVKKYIQKGDKKGAKYWLLRKKTYEKYKKDNDAIHINLIQQIIDIKNAESEKNLTQILKTSNQIYKNVGLDADKFAEVTEDWKELNNAKEEMYENFKDFGSGENDEDIEEELKKLEKENTEQEFSEFPNIPEKPENPFSEEQQQLYK